MAKFPDFSGTWKIRARILRYDNPEAKNPTFEKREYPSVQITQHGRFFKYAAAGDERQPKLGVLEPNYLKGKLVGWKGHIVDTKQDNDTYILNFTKITEDNRVLGFDITGTESGYGTSDQQKPTVEYAQAKRVELKEKEKEKEKEKAKEEPKKETAKEEPKKEKQEPKKKAEPKK